MEKRKLIHKTNNNKHQFEEKEIVFLQFYRFLSLGRLNNELISSIMIDNINKLSKTLDSNNKPQQTAASIVNLTDDGELDIV